MYKLIAIAGRKGHGKDTAGAALVAKGYTNVKFADALKGMFRVLLAEEGLDKATIQEMVDGGQKEEPIKYLEGRFLEKLDVEKTAQKMVAFLMEYQGAKYPTKKNLDEPQDTLQGRSAAYAIEVLADFIIKWRDNADVTPRLIMQELGTEYGRVSLGDKIWTTATRGRIKSIAGPVVVTDMRFVNERDEMAGMGALLLRVKRPMLTNGQRSDHPSETAIDDLVVDHELLNDGGIEKLQNHTTLAANNQKAGIKVINIDKNSAIQYPHIMDHPEMRYAQRIVSSKHDAEAARAIYEIEYLAPIRQ